MTDINKEEPLYSPEILTKLDSKKYESVYSLPVTPSNPGPGLKFRPLKPSDFNKGYLELLTQLTVVGEVTEKQFLERFASMQSCPNTYYVTVIEDINTNEIIGSGTLVVEQKFIRNCSARGRVEDIVVSDKYRGRHLGKLLIATLIMLAEEFKCYKISLECKDKMVPFYTSMGFYIEPGVSSNYLEKRF